MRRISEPTSTGDMQRRYRWELEMDDGTVLAQNTHRWQEADPDRVVRASIVPNGSGRRVDMFGPGFWGWLGRGFLKPVLGRYALAEYAHCIETDHHRLWVLASDGRVLLTPPDYVLRV